MKKFVFILIFILFFGINNLAHAESCSSDGYTIITINGMIADKNAAIINRDKIKDLIRHNITNNFIYNNQKIKVDYIHNETHILGFSDLFDASVQKAFEFFRDVASSYDFINIINDLNDKLDTQKVLFIPHSQGNFYTNDIYNKLGNKLGGIPTKSMGIYGIAPPTSYIAGRGKYITSSNDKIVNMVRKYQPFSVLEANVVINNPISNKENLWGHSLSKIYLKYESKRIAFEIKQALDKLQNNNIQDFNSPCVARESIDIDYVKEKIFYTIADPLARGSLKGIIALHNFSKYISDGVASLGGKIGFSLRNTIITIINKINSMLIIGNTSGKYITASAIQSQNLDKQILETPKKQEKNKKETEVIESVEAILNVVVPKEDILKKEIKDLQLGIKDNKENSSIIEIEIVNEPEKIIDEKEIKRKKVRHGGRSYEVKEVEEIKDIIAPIITLNGESIIEIEKDSIYTEKGATALDDVDGEVEVIISGEVDTSLAGLYTIIYTATDTAENTVEITRTIIVEEPIYTTWEDLIVSENMTLPAGEYFYNNLTITNNAILTLEGNPDLQEDFKGVKINVGSLVVGLGSSISANGQGYKIGPGSSEDYHDAASYGGQGGGKEAKEVYGLASEPIHLGSGNGSYHGGGAIYLNVLNSLENNGIISANGEINRTSGGSIYVKTKYLSGSGSFIASGMGSKWPYSTGGGGGRIAIHYNNSSFEGEALANAGIYCFYGCNPAGEHGTVGFFDTIENNLIITSNFRFEENLNSLFFNKIILKDGAIVSADSLAEVHAEELILEANSFFEFNPNSYIDIPIITVKENSSLTFPNGENIVSDNLSVESGATVTFVNNEEISFESVYMKSGSTITSNEEVKLILNITNLEIEENSYLSVASKGLKEGPGTPEESSRSGGNHGGINYSELVYGSAINPSDFGSGGRHYASRGGGVLSLNISNTLLNNGIISADGNGNASGGSVYINTKNLEGFGEIRANGGAGAYSSVQYSAGHGGRVAIYYENNLFTGEVKADGGCTSFDGWSMTCADDGTAGLFDSVNNDLYIDNSWQFRKVDNPLLFNNIFISNGAEVRSEEGVELFAEDIDISGGSVFILAGDESISANNFSLSGGSIVSIVEEKVLSLILSNLNIEQGSSILVNDKGYKNGPGTSEDWENNGSSYGGEGGGLNPKPVYGSETEPIDFGSGIGGSRGGGAIYLNISESLENNGIISANGGNKRTSGGSVYIVTNQLLGNGIISVYGGKASWPYRYAGGGGRIAIYYQDNIFSGVISAEGGKYCYSGCRFSGKNGTIYLINEPIKEDEEDSGDDGDDGDDGGVPSVIEIVDF